MPKTVPTDIGLAFQDDVLTIAYCMRITRTDGIVLGFTSYDKTITFDGTNFEPAGGAEASALMSSVGTGIDTLELSGQLTDDRITEDDLRALRYQNAIIETYFVDYTDVADDNVILQYKGRIGTTVLKDGVYQVEVRSLSTMLKQVVGEVTSPLCQCRRLGDSCCKVDLDAGGWTEPGMPMTSPPTDPDEVEFELPLIGHPTGWADKGIMRADNGPNEGLERDIKTHVEGGSDSTFILNYPFPFAFEPGNTVTIEAGCKRRYLEDCVGKFGNGVNFHGQEKLPGNTKITQVGRTGR